MIQGRFGVPAGLLNEAADEAPALDFFAERHNIGGRPSPEVVHVDGDESGAAVINVIAQTQE